MKKTECPSCAMEVDAGHEMCPVCGYEFPEESGWVSSIVWIMIILLLLWVLL